MDSLKPPKGPRKRSSTNQLHGQHCKRIETAYVAEDEDGGSEDISGLKAKLKLSREKKKEERELVYVQKDIRKRRRLFCCSCQTETGFDGDQCSECGHERCAVCLL